MRKVLMLAVLLSATTVAAAAIDLTELGFGLTLSLPAFREQGKVRLWISVGAYAHLTIDEEWRLRVGAGTGITEFSPYADVTVIRVYTPHLMALGNLFLQTRPSRGLLATAKLGGSYVSDPLFDFRLSATSYPLGWRLTSRASELRLDLFVSGNLMVDVTVGAPDTGLIGEAVELTLVRSSPAVDPIISLGRGWALAIDATTHIGAGF